MSVKQPHVFLIAGEPSGDALGASLLHALKQKRPDVIIGGVGGPKMEEEGLRSLFPIDDLAVMGIAEVVPKLKTILGKINDTARVIEQTRPDIIVSIDSPDFCFRVLKKVRKSIGVDAPTLIHYVAPTVWAWREGRAQKIAKFLDGLICLFDFEPPYFEKEGLRSIAVGHPVVETEALHADGATFRQSHNIPSAARTVGVFFGSRSGELKRHSQIFLDVMVRLPADTVFIIPTLPHLRERIKAMTADLGARVYITTDKAEKWQAFAACDCALAVSGTIGLELSAASVPHIIGYRTSALTHQLVKRMVKVRFAHLLNIMLDSPIIPEFLQYECTPDNLLAALLPLMNDSAERQIQQAAFARFAHQIGADDETPPSMKAADFILSFKA